MDRWERCADTPSAPQRTVPTATVWSAPGQASGVREQVLVVFEEVNPTHSVPNDHR